MCLIGAIGYPNRPWPFIFIAWVDLPRKKSYYKIYLLKALVVLGLCLDRSDRSVVPDQLQHLDWSDRLVRPVRPVDLICCQFWSSTRDPWRTTTPSSGPRWCSHLTMAQVIHYLGSTTANCIFVATTHWITEKFGWRLCTWPMQHNCGITGSRWFRVNRSGVAFVNWWIVGLDRPWPNCLSSS